MRRVLTVALIALAACSNQTGGTKASLAEANNEPPTTLSPEAAFRADVEGGLTFGAPEPGVDPVAQSLSFAHSVCDALDTAARITNGGDSSIAQTAAEMGLDVIMASDLDDEVTDYLMRAAVKHLCPKHSGTVTAYLDSR